MADGRSSRFVSGLAELAGLRKTREKTPTSPSQDQLQRRIQDLEQMSSNTQKHIQRIMQEKNEAVNATAELAAKIEATDKTLKAESAAHVQAQDIANKNYRVAKKWHTEAQRREHQYTQLRKKSEITEKQLQDCMAQLQSIQLNNLQRGQKTWHTEEDGQIREMLVSFYKSIRFWANSYAVKSAAGVLSVDVRVQMDLLFLMQQVTSIPDLDSLAGFKYPFLVLAALLSEHISKIIFSNPFFAFDGPNDFGREGSFGTKLREVFEEIGKVNVLEAHKWRSQLLRSVFPRPLDVPPGQVIDTVGISQYNLAAICEVVCDCFLGGPAALLIRQMNDQEFQACVFELRDLIIQAGNLYARVQTQQAFFVWCSPERLLRQEFSIDSPYLRPDRFHRLEDDEDKSHDGKRVSIVVSPCVEIVGDRKCENYDTSRVLSKAVVYLEEAAFSREVLVSVKQEET